MNVNMKRRSEIDTVSPNLKNCFGFNENEINSTVWDNSSALNDTSAPLVFHPDKPYRLALYVRPSQQRRIQKTNASLLVKNVLEKQVKAKKNENSTVRPLEEVIEDTKSRKKSKKVQNVKLFDENIENVSKNTRKATEKGKQQKEVTIMEVPSSRKNILKESNTKPLTKTKQIKIRRSYERKFKEKETENIPEPPSEQIIKDLEIKKLSRTKQKKVKNKEDEEFEKWASSINSDFNDVDKFELSIAYD